jgi:hypothetical protein
MEIIKGLVNPSPSFILIASGISKFHAPVKVKHCVVCISLNLNLFVFQYPGGKGA